MKVGRYTIKWEGHGYAVGELKITTSKSGKVLRRLHDAKYYGTLRGALESLPERYASEVVNTCDDLVSLRERLGQLAIEVLSPIEEAVQGVSERAQGGSDEPPVYG